MFKINQAQTFEERVEVHFPNGNGQFTKGSFVATFKRISEDEFKATSSDQDVARAVLVSVSGIADDNDQEMPQDRAMESVLNDSCCVPAIARTYVEATRSKNLRRGNS